MASSIPSAGGSGGSSFVNKNSAAQSEESVTSVAKSLFESLKQQGPGRFVSANQVSLGGSLEKASADLALRR